MILCTLFLYVHTHIDATHTCPVPPKGEKKNHDYFTVTTTSSIIPNMILINNSMYFVFLEIINEKKFISLP